MRKGRGCFSSYCYNNCKVKLVLSILHLIEGLDFPLNLSEFQRFLDVYHSSYIAQCFNEKLGHLTVKKCTHVGSVILSR